MREENERRRDLSGTSIDGRYRLIARREDAAPMVERYEAEQLGLSRKVEVQILRLRDGEGEALEERFKESAAMIARFDHPSLVPIFDSGVYQGCPFVVRGIVEGRSLEAIAAVKSSSAIATVEKASAILADLADALAALHAAGFVARRLSLAEVIVTPRGRARILELRAARAMAELGEQEGDPRADLAVLGAIARQIVPGEGPQLIDAGRARLLSLIDRLCAESLVDRPASAEQVSRALRLFAGRTIDASESDTMLEGLRPIEPLPVPVPVPVPVVVEAKVVEEKVVEEKNAEAWAIASSITSAVEVAKAPERDIVTERLAVRTPVASEVVPEAPPKNESLLDLSVVQSPWKLAADRAGNYLADRRNRRTVLAGAGGAVLLILAILIAGSAKRPEVEVASPAALAAAAGTRELAQSARERTNRGDTASAIDELERALVQDNRYGDAHLHAALAHAYVRAGRGADSLQHFAIAIRQDPNALEETDIAELVGQLALPQKDGDRAAALATELGERAVPALSDVSSDAASDKNLRARSQRVLRSLASR